MNEERVPKFERNRVRFQRNDSIQLAQGGKKQLLHKI